MNMCRAIQPTISCRANSAKELRKTQYVNGNVVNATYGIVEQSSTGNEPYFVIQNRVDVSLDAMYNSGLGAKLNLVKMCLPVPHTIVSCPCCRTENIHLSHLDDAPKRACFGRVLDKGLQFAFVIFDFCCVTLSAEMRTYAGRQL
jgi:hypothetical protein